ncbi:hypothetical protein MFIFM68171_09637 [Madurella fahalii]|uniref:Heterokaryon incompatibility domain-containing protein n=1 Tax=Madurella fahalii TaxID=1157608 RepID=A0ABQ0GNW5_9PEZI
MEIVRRLGKRYFWIDMLCINQADEDNKMKHIDIIFLGRGARQDGQQLHLPRPGRRTCWAPAVLRDPLAAISVEEKRQRNKHHIERYSALLEAYSAKHVSFGSDALNSFQVVLSQLSDGSCGDGFFWGLRVEILHLALLWEHCGDAKRRRQFPSWSWAGWQGELFIACDDGADGGDGWTNNYQPPFNAFRATDIESEEARLVQIFEDPRLRWSDWHAGYGPILDLADVTIQRSVSVADFDAPVDIEQTLSVGGVLFQPGVLKPAPELAADYSRRARSVFAVTINGATCIFVCIDHIPMTLIAQATTINTG